MQDSIYVLFRSQETFQILHDFLIEGFKIVHNPTKNNSLIDSLVQGECPKLILSFSYRLKLQSKDGKFDIVLTDGMLMYLLHFYNSCL